MRTREQTIGLLKQHTWYASGNLGVPGMADQLTYKCYCGWNGDDPHGHVADQILALEPSGQRCRCGWFHCQACGNHLPDRTGGSAFCRGRWYCYEHAPFGAITRNPPGGRPSISEPINVRLGEELQAAVDLYAVHHNIGRAEAVRRLVNQSILLLEDKRSHKPQTGG